MTGPTVILATDGDDPTPLGELCADLGREARGRGEGREHCPFDPKGFAGRAWMRGFDATGEVGFGN